MDYIIMCNELTFPFTSEGFAFVIDDAGVILFIFLISTIGLLVVMSNFGCLNILCS